MSLDFLRRQVEKKTPLGEKIDRFLSKRLGNFTTNSIQQLTKRFANNTLAQWQYWVESTAIKIPIVSQLKMSPTGDSLADFPQEATVRTPSGRLSEPARFWELGGRN